jgi:hypothetical protein
MKRIGFFVLLVLGLPACKSLTSTTTIDPNKSFVLGDGPHGGYTAQIKNVGADAIEVMQSDRNGKVTALGSLQRRESGEYKVGANTTVIFKNKSLAEKGVIEIIITGNLSGRLSMGYRDNR